MLKQRAMAQGTESVVVTTGRRPKAPGIRLIILVTMLGLVGAPTAIAADPQPVSAVIDRFVLEVDHVYGYQILRPVGWDSVDLENQRGFVHVDASDPESKLVLAVTNLKVAAALTGEDGMLANWELFLQDGSKAGWATGTERLWKSLGIDFESYIPLKNGMTYVRRQGPEQIIIVAYIIGEGGPLAVALSATGAFGDLMSLEGSGIIEDFETMAASAAAAKVDRTADAQRAGGELAVPLAGPWTADSGFKALGAFTYRLQDQYYQAPPKVYWLYEYMFYANHQTFTMWLYRTNVTDSPQSACQYGGFSLIQHPINKSTTVGNGLVTDSWFPNKIVAHLNPTTAHMMVFGNPAVVNCQWYFPYTH